MVKITKNINSSLSAIVHTKSFIPDEKRGALREIAKKVFNNQESFVVSEKSTLEQLFKQSELSLAWKLKELFNSRSPTTLKRVINFYYRKLKHLVRWCHLNSEDKQKVIHRVNQLMRDRLNGYCKFNHKQEAALKQEIQYSIVKTFSDNKALNKKINFDTPSFENNFNNNLSPTVSLFMQHIEKNLIQQSIYPIVENSQESHDFQHVIEQYETMLTQKENSSIYDYYRQLATQKKATLNFLSQSLFFLQGKPCREETITSIFKTLKDIHEIAMSIVEVKKPQGHVIPEREKVLEVYVVILLRLAKIEFDENRTQWNFFIPDLIRMAGTYVEDLREHDHYGYYSSAQANLETALAFIYKEVSKLLQKKK